MTSLPQLTADAWTFVLRAETGTGRVLVVGRRKQGCAGWSYTLARQEEVPTDMVVETVNLPDGPAFLAVRPADVPHLKGAQARLARLPLGHQLFWDNPQVMDQCGCGLSVLTDPTPSA